MGPPFEFFFVILLLNACLQIKKGPPFTFFGTVRHFPKDFFFQKFQVFFHKNVLRFLSLRYSADLRRSRLVYFWRYATSSGDNRKSGPFRLKILVWYLELSSL